MVWSEDVTNRICLFCDGIGGPSRKLTQGTCKFAVVCRWGKIRSKKNNVNTQILVCVGHFDTRRQWKVYYRRFMIGPSAQWLIGVFCISKRTKYFAHFLQQNNACTEVVLWFFSLLRKKNFRNKTPGSRKNDYHLAPSIMEDIGHQMPAVLFMCFWLEQTCGVIIKLIWLDPKTELS